MVVKRPAIMGDQLRSAACEASTVSPVATSWVPACSVKNILVTKTEPRASYIHIGKTCSTTEFSPQPQIFFVYSTSIKHTFIFEGPCMRFLLLCRQSNTYHFNYNCAFVLSGQITPQVYPQISEIVFPP